MFRKLWGISNSERKKIIRINDFFERVEVINLDRREDRLKAIDVQAIHLGIQFYRRKAHDGRDPEISSEFEKLDPFRYVEHAPEKVPKLPDETEHNHEIRLRAEGLNTSSPLLGSPGALALLKSTQSILVDAIADGVETLLILEDDVVFHKDTLRNFDAIVGKLPLNWKILQLGTMRYGWSKKRTSYYSKNLLRQGRSIGSHAVGLRREVFGEFLELISRYDSAQDIGALSTLCSRHFNNSFVTIPQICIQGTLETDIQTSSNAGSTHSFERDVKLRWKRTSYLNPNELLRLHSV